MNPRAVALMFVFVQSKHDLKGKDQLLVLIRKFPEGLAVVEVKDAYSNVLEDLQVTLTLLIRQLRCF